MHSRRLGEKKNHMNHLLDTHSETIDHKHSKLPDTLIERCIKRLKDKSYEPRIRDALKAIQLKQEVVKTSELERSETHRAEKFFWQEIEAIRRDELPRLHPESINLEAQILSTIIGLKPHVKNGILPVKIITDTFNQARSNESQLTYHRIGRLLSAMGFTRAKTPNGCSAIIWDDKLLFKSP